MDVLKKSLSTIKRYFKPLSVSWWAGVAMIVSGSLQIYGGEIPVVSPVVRPILAELSTGGALYMLLNGFGLIGLRGAFDDIKEKLK